MIMKYLIYLLLLLSPVLISAQMVEHASMNLPPATAMTGSPLTLTCASVTGTQGTSQTTTISWSGLTQTITVPATTGYLVSKDNATFTTSTTITATGTGSQILYYALSSSNSPGTVNGTCTITAPGVPNVVITLNGTVSSVPLITLSPTSITGLNGTAGTAGPSQGYTLSFVGVAGVLATSTAPVEISKDGGGSWNLTQSVTSSPTSMLARIASSATAGPVSINIIHTASGATTQNEAVTGTVSSGTSDSVQFLFTASTTPTPPAGVVRVAGNPAASVITATGGLSNSITLTSVATANWAQLSGTGSALDNGGKAGSTVPFMPDPSLRSIWFMFSSSGHFADSTVVTMAKPQIIIAGLNPALTYKVYIGASLDNAQFSLTCNNKFRIVGAATYISPLMDQFGNNTHPTAAEGPQFTSVTPNASGQLKFYFFTEVGQEVTTVATIKVVQN